MTFFTMLKFHWIKFWMNEIMYDYGYLPTLMSIQILPMRFTN